MKNDECCDPTWNYLARTIMFYVLPLGLMSYFLFAKQIGLHRDFIIPIFFAAIVPYINIKKKIWVKKDFQNRDCFYWTIPFVFAGIWLAALSLASNAWLAVVYFVLLFFLYDFFLLKYELLKLYGQEVDRLQQGFCKKFFPMGGFWWAYIGTGFFLMHHYGSDSLFSMLISLVLLIVPLQSALSFFANKNAAPERFDRIESVAVIGAGFSGVYATKWLTEKGIDVDCFEKSAAIGGVWQFSASETKRGSVFKNTRATSSKHLMHAMDFRVNEDFPDFPDRSQYMEHLQSYVDHFGIRDRIVLNAAVKSVQKRDGQWDVMLATPDKEECKRYDAVVVCAGPQGTPRIEISQDRLYSRFSGNIVHAAAYKDSSQVARDKRVLIVGAGESAADIVAECARENCELFWSSHRGQWFADRNVGPFAADHFLGFGMRQLLGKFLNFEYKIRRFVIQNNINIIWGEGGHGIREWIPNALYLHQFLNKSRDGILEIYRGRVTPKRAVADINGKKVKFAGEDDWFEFDTIILATGFRPHWPFLADAPCKLYKLVFNPADPTLSFVGLARPVLGSITSLAEMQSRWIAGVYSGHIALPHRSIREGIVFEDYKDHQKRYRDSSGLKVLTDQTGYSEELASYMGIQVPWLQLLFSNPRGFWIMMQSPWIAVQFELGSKDASKREWAIKTIEEELPNCKHPVFLFQKILILWAVIAITAAGVLWHFFLLWQILALIAGYLLLTAIRNRRKDLAWMTAPNEVN